MKLSNSEHLSILVILAIIVVIIILFIFSLKLKTNEGFTSGFRQMYRPHIRKERLIVEGN